MKLFVCLILASIAISAFADLHENFENFKKSHGKKYHTSEHAVRLNNFKKRDEAIKKHNSDPKQTFTMAHNHISDMHDHELSELLGAIKPNKPEGRLWQPDSDDRAATLPASLDYRTSKCLQPVKNQGQCGSCYTFAAICPLEYSKCNKTGTPINLSEQELVDCDTNDGGCNGGFYTRSWSWLKSSGGAESTASYGAYTSGKTKAPGTCTFNKSKVSAQVASYANVPASAAAMMAALQKGPLAVAIKVVRSFQSYSSGVYSDSTCTTKSNGSYDINHAVTVVGYGKLNGIDHWIVRNSWGTGWGQGGYIYVKRGVNMCAIESYAASVVAV